MLRFERATKKRSKLRMTIDGPSGSGKTFTALTFAFALGEQVALIDTERGSASKYADVFPPFDVLELETFSPALYTQAIQAAQGYDVLIIDSLSHAWEGSEGALEMVDKAAAKNQNRFTAWRDVTPVHNKMVDAILRAPFHVITTMRSKTEYVLEADDKGRMVPRKVGMAPIQRPGMEYEFDIVADMDWDHRLVVSKSRCSAVDGDVTLRPTAEWMKPVIAWLAGGGGFAYWTAEERKSFAVAFKESGVAKSAVQQGLGVDDPTTYEGTYEQAMTVLEALKSGIPYVTIEERLGCPLSQAVQERSREEILDAIRA
jgi:hypothetical protein